MALERASKSSLTGFAALRLGLWYVVAFVVLLTGCATAMPHERQEEDRLITFHSNDGQMPVLGNDEVLALIGASPKLERETFDPQALLRAANALIRLGRDSTTRLLLRFINSVEERASVGRSQYNEVTRVIPIALVLREPSSGQFECVKNAWMYDGLTLTEEPWFEFPLAIVDDVPFLVAVPSGGSSPEELAIIVVEELKRSGVRKKPLCPAFLPTAACTRLLRGEQWSTVAGFAGGKRSLAYMEACMRQQALLALHHVYAAHTEFVRAASEGHEYDWETPWANVRALGIMWNADSDFFCIVR